MSVLASSKIIMPFQYFQEKGFNNLHKLAINHLNWHDFSCKLQKYSELLAPYQPGTLLLKVPNTPDGLALLLASSTLSLTTIIAPWYYTDDFLAGVIDSYHVTYYITLVDDELVVQNKSHPVKQLVNQPILCLLTSGTTGKPKCIQHTWDTLIARIAIKEKFQQCAWLCGYPMTHFAGMQVLLQCLYNGGHLVLPENNQVSTVLAAMQQYRPDYLNCTPTFVRQLFLSQNDFIWETCGLKRITLGGEVVEQQLINMIKKYIATVGVTHTYASTELGTLISVHDEKEGIPLALIDDEHFMIKEDTLWVKPSSSAMLAYLDQPSLSASEWFNTKDLVVIKGDRVLFAGRQDELINIGGYKVNPKIVEQIILDIPGVNQVVVMSKKNPIMGQIIKANILLDASQKELITKKDIIQYCKVHLPEYMVPRIIEWVDELTVTPTQKLLRREG